MDDESTETYAGFVKATTPHLRIRRIRLGWWRPWLVEASGESAAADVHEVFVPLLVLWGDETRARNRGQARYAVTARALRALIAGDDADLLMQPDKREAYRIAREHPQYAR